MTRQDRFVAAHVAVAAALMVGGLLGLDRAIAEQVSGSGLERHPIFVQGTLLLDWVSGKELSKFLIGGVLGAVAFVLLCVPRTRRVGWNTLFIALVQLSATLIAGVGKNIFGRLRPFQVLQGGDWEHAWFVGGSAFPSGHTGFYFGLFLPLAYLFPRWRWPLMIVPWFIAVARIDANDHFLADVAASIALAGLLTLILARITRRDAA